MVGLSHIIVLSSLAPITITEGDVSVPLHGLVTGLSVPSLTPAVLTTLLVVVATAEVRLVVSAVPAPRRAAGHLPPVRCVPVHVRQLRRSLPRVFPPPLPIWPLGAPPAGAGPERPRRGLAVRAATGRDQVIRLQGY